MDDYVVMPLYNKPRDHRPAKDLWSPGINFHTCLRCHSGYQGGYDSKECSTCVLGEKPPPAPPKRDEYMY